MKKLNTLLSSFIITLTLSAQAPEKMNYQAVIRDANNSLVINQLVGMKIQILQGSPTGQAVYTETHTQTSNENGLVTLEIGLGTTIGSGVFSSIDWGIGPYFLKTETDPTGTSNYTISGTSQLMSVPYALHAKTAESLTNNSTPTYSLGLWPSQGGYIFWVSADGKHGLVSATIDQGLSNWYNAEDIISDPANHSIDGQKFRDWRLPTKNELNEMNAAAAFIGGFGTKTYWTSVLAGNGSAWRQNFLSGLQFNTTAYTLDDFFFVRAVRSF